MFKFADIGRMWVPVDLPVGEGEAPARIWLLQTIYTREELRQRDRVLAEHTAAAQPEEGQAEGVESLMAALDRVIAIEDADLAELVERTHDWRDVSGEDGQPAAFSAERFRALLAYLFFARAVRQALFTASREGVRKN